MTYRLDVENGMTKLWAMGRDFAYLVLETEDFHEALDAYATALGLETEQ
jgi:hypothetical protein